MRRASHGQGRSRAECHRRRERAPGNPPSEWDGGGDGGSAFGGAIYNTGTLTVAHTTFQSNFAGGQPSGFGRSTGWGGNGGAPGSDGEAGAFSVGVGFNCYAAGATCG